jgi:hypothetical protein
MDICHFICYFDYFEYINFTIIDIYGSILVEKEF